MVGIFQCMLQSKPENNQWLFLNKYIQVHIRLIDHPTLAAWLGGSKTPCPFLRTPLSVSQTKHSLHTFHQCTQDCDVNVCFRATGTKLTDCQVFAFIQTLIYRRHKLVQYFIANFLCVMLGNHVLVVTQFPQPA